MAVSHNGLLRSFGSPQAVFGSRAWRIAKLAQNVVIRHAQVRGDAHDPQRTSPLSGEGRCTRSACLRSLPVWHRHPSSTCMAFCATSPPFATDPSAFRFGPRCQLGTPPTNSLGTLAPRRGRISMMIGTASTELVQPLGVHPGFFGGDRQRGVHAFRFSWLVLHFGSHVDAGRHRFSCPFLSLTVPALRS